MGVVHTAVHLVILVCRLFAEAMALTKMRAAAFVALLAFWGMGGTALAGPGEYVLASSKVVLERHDDGTGTFEVSLINLTDKDATVSAVAKPNPPQTGCKAAVNSENRLEATRQSTFTIELKDCSFPDEGSFAVDIMVEKTSFPLSVGPEPHPSPNWDLMYIFGATESFPVMDHDVV